MAVDLRQVMGGILTFSMFIMLGNMVKKDHIDPFLVSFFSKIYYFIFNSMIEAWIYSTIYTVSVYYTHILHKLKLI